MDRKGGKEKNLMLIELLQVALGIRNSLSRIPSDAEWVNVYKLAARHGFVGFLYGGIERLPNEQQLHKMLLLKWFGPAECYRIMYERRRKAVENLNGLWCAATTVLRLYLEIAIRPILCLKLCGLSEPVTFKKSKQYPFDYQVISFEESLERMSESLRK